MWVSVLIAYILLLLHTEYKGGKGTEKGGGIICLEVCHNLHVYSRLSNNCMCSITFWQLEIDYSQVPNKRVYSLNYLMLSC